MGREMIRNVAQSEVKLDSTVAGCPVSMELPESRLVGACTWGTGVDTSRPQPEVLISRAVSPIAGLHAILGNKSLVEDPR